MSGRQGRAEVVRAQLPLLDRLIDDSPEQARETTFSPAEAMAVLRRSVRRDLEALLNARRRWRSFDPAYTELANSPIGFGIPDFASGGFNDPKAKEALRREIEATIKRFEPRFVSVKVALLNAGDLLDATLRLRIEALLHADPAPEPVAFDTTLDATTADVIVRARDAA